MTPRPLADASTAVAYQDVTLGRLRGLFDQIDVDLEDVLLREESVARSLRETSSEMDAVRARLEALGIQVQGERRADLPTDPDLSEPSVPRYPVPETIRETDVEQLARRAEAHLERLGIDLSRDPLQQVLPDSRIASSLEAFSREHGDVSWRSSDWGVVLAAGAIATLLDIVLVRIPRDTHFLGRSQSGSPLTGWLQDKQRAASIHARFLRRFEATAKVPYDAATNAATGGLVDGMRPATHRLQSFGHDPLLGFLCGVADIMHGSGTYVDKAGKVVQVAARSDPVDLISALLMQIRHLLSDVYTPAGLPAPLFSLLQLGTVASPFALGPSGVKVPWTDVARFMYTHGYDLRHCFSMGVVPGTVEMIIRAYWLLDGFARGVDPSQRKRETLKLRSMLLMGHSFATSGTLLKTGVLFGMNPLALNYSQILAMGPTSLAWLRESSARDRRIARGLEETWEQLASGL
ncbi:hypothetical protein [Brachybacterium sp. ACRRE]|uniref:hypothetical protein n=1 Tax=Brachybacterium sp. ACRRE TaxID=2918184 RepID=UPI001EF3BE9F|nr:hypothetical protein [Brachybacterium sp. ACRRE]MCG7310731.1 hypothetical protein [Brachybacterium sp. ACRRE]